MSAEPMSDERRQEIEVFVNALPNSMAYVYGCATDLLAEVDRLRSDLDAAQRINDAAKRWGKARTAHTATVLAHGQGKATVAAADKTFAASSAAAAALLAALAEDTRPETEQ